MTQTTYGPSNEYYFYRIQDTLMKSLEVHPRLTVIRIDLRIPDNGAYSHNPLERDTPTSFANSETNLIKRFIASIKAQIDAQGIRQSKLGRRVHQCQINYVWVKEYSKEHKSHYHMALMLNKDRYYCLGDFGEQHTLAGIVIQAWGSALQIPREECCTLVHFPENAIYYLKQNASHGEFEAQSNAILSRLQYLAKDRTKIYGTGLRNFGCSNPKK